MPGPVQYFEALTSSSNSFSLYWVAPALEDQNGEILGFDISYQTGNYRFIIIANGACNLRCELEINDFFNLTVFLYEYLNVKPTKCSWKESP